MTPCDSTFTGRSSEHVSIGANITHWGRVTHICVSKLTIIGSDNGLSPCRRQAITWTNGRILFIRNLGTNFSEILSEIFAFSFKKIHWKMASILSRPQCDNRQCNFSSQAHYQWFIMNSCKCILRGPIKKRSPILAPEFAKYVIPWMKIKEQHSRKPDYFTNRLSTIVLIWDIWSLWVFDIWAADKVKRTLLGLNQVILCQFHISYLICLLTIGCFRQGHHNIHC